ncbi:MAG: PAS domain S-box protein [Rhodospirillales bacterium]|nr:PAS domain S-box protein [Rhodospirillales bacterium]
MAKRNNRRQKRLRKTKADLVAEIAALERRLAVGGGVGDAYFRAVIRNSPTAIYVRDVDSRYLLVNKAYERLYKVRDENIFGKTPFDVFARDSAEFIVARDREILKSGRKVEYESDVTLIDGTTRVQSVIMFPFHDSQSNAIGVCGILTDLAQQKRVEQAVRVSEERLHAAIDSLREGFILFDANDRLVAFNDKYLQLRPASQKILDRGGTFEDMVREHVRLGMIPEAAGREEAFVRERMEQHRNFKDPIVRRFVDGRWYLIDEARTPEGGTALSVVDITDLKRAENALRKSEALFRAVVNHSPTKIHIKDVEDRYALINKEAEKLFGVTDEEGRGKTSYDPFPKEVADAFTAHDRTVIASGHAVEKEEEFTLEDGVHTYLTVKFPIYDLDGMAAVGAIGTDITERKRAEETVRRLAAAIEGLSENFALYGPDDRLIICNRNYRDLNAAIAEATRPGVTFEQHARAMVEHGLAPQAVGREEAWVRERLERHRNPGGPIEVARQDGRWFLVHEQRMADGSTATIATDITERKRAEQELEHQKMLFEVVFRDVPDAMVLADTDRKVMMCNPSITRTFGYEPRELLGKNTGILYATREEYERQGKLRFNPDAEFKLDPYVASYRRKSGELFPGETVGTPIRDRDGNTLGFIAVIRDVTERQKAEEMLKESEERFRSVLDSSPSAVSLKDKDNRFLLVNNTFATWMKADAKEIIGKTIFDRYPKEEAEFIAQNNREVFTTGKSYVGEST